MLRLGIAGLNYSSQLKHDADASTCGWGKRMTISDLGRDALGICAAVAILAGCGGSQGPASALPNPMVQVSQAVAQRHDANSSVASTFPAGPDGQLNGHLYVASSGGVMERFRIVHGVPQSTPDRTYSGGAPIAVDSHGYLYASKLGIQGLCGGGLFSEGVTIVVYAPHSHSTSPVRTLNLSGGSDEDLGIGSLFADGQGYVYVGVAVTNTETGMGAFSYGVNVFSPGASGCDGPVQTFDSGRCNNSRFPVVPAAHRETGCPGYGLTGLAMDAQANLHVSNNLSTNSVLSFESPVTDPTQIADLTGPGIVSPSGLAVDASDELYVDNAGQGTSSFVAAYRAKANGSPPPDREISVTGEQSFGNGIAIAAGQLIIPDPTANVVYAVRARKNGVQTPIWTLALSSGFSPQDVKLGP